MRTTLVSTVSLDEPISIPEARSHLRNPEVTENSEILRFIQSAKRLTEHKLGRKLMAETWEGYLDTFPTSEIEFPYAPLSSVTYIKYYDSANVLQTVDSTDYLVDAAGETPRVILAFEKSWPSTLSAVQNAVIIRFVIGYANADAIPQNVRHYMKLLIAEFDAHRSLTTEREVMLTPWAERLLDADRVLYVV